MLIAGIDIGGTTVKCGLFDPDKGLIQSCRYPTPFGDPEKMADLLEAFVRQYPVDLIGIGTAGAVYTATQTVCATNLGWEDVPLKAMVQDRLHLPVWVDNDAQSAMMAEWYDGACTGMRDAVYLTLGTGIGGALLLNGAPWRGRLNVGAEFGHMIVHPDGRLCACGRKGCFELYASATAMRTISHGLSAKQVIDGAKAGVAKMQAYFQTYIHELCIGLANLNIFFTPEIIVLGGGVSRAGQFLSDACNRELQTIFAAHPEELVCGVTTAVHQNDAGMLGAAVLAMHKLEKR